MFGSEDPAVFAGTSLRFDETGARLWGASPDFLGRKLPDGTFERRPHRVFARDALTGALEIMMPIPDAGFGNDIAVHNDGTVFITDSIHPRVLRIAPGSSEIVVYAEDSRLSSVGEGINGVGLGGITLAADGETLIVATYGGGQLFAIASGGTEIREIPISRPLENPDGLALTADGDLLLVEGAVRSGDGRLVRLPDPLNLTTRPVETLVDGLNMPVNLMIEDDLIFVTESGLGHRFTASKSDQEEPEIFYVHRFQLSAPTN